AFAKLSGEIGKASGGRAPRAVFGKDPSVIGSRRLGGGPSRTNAGGGEPTVEHAATLLEGRLTLRPEWGRIQTDTPGASLFHALWSRLALCLASARLDLISLHLSTGADEP